jgi:RimJ/RimL family protein N-acetyltransferase
MTPHPDQLYAFPFTEADQARLVGFSCGTEPWSRYVAEWILGSDVLDSLKRGNRVWLFEKITGEIVGFGSLGIARWKWPPPDGTPANIVILPMLGIGEPYHGQPADPEWRYSQQMMQHLISEAQLLTEDWAEDDAKRLKWLALMVNKDNARAIRFYERCGFELIPGVERKHGNLVMKLWLGE